MAVDKRRLPGSVHRLVVLGMIENRQQEDIFIYMYNAEYSICRRVRREI